VCYSGGGAGVEFNIKISKRPTYEVEILFKNGNKEKYNIYADNLVLKKAIRVWQPSLGGPYRTGKLPKHKKGNPNVVFSNIDGMKLLLSEDRLWSFDHTDGRACIRTGQIAKIDLTKIDDYDRNPLNNEDHYDDPCN
jgi:hypothetical protein